MEHHENYSTVEKNQIVHGHVALILLLQAEVIAFTHACKYLGGSYV
jgi:hypothetical protein